MGTELSDPLFGSGGGNDNNSPSTNGLSSSAAASSWYAAGFAKSRWMADLPGRSRGLSASFSSALNELPSPPASLVVPAEASGANQRAVGILHFAAMSYFLVSGGPIGIEYCVIYGGPLLSLVGFVTMPLLWSMPQALMTAELSTVLPDNGGYVLWAQYTFGDFMGFIAGLNGIVSSLVDSSIYPTLMATYVLALVDGGPGTGGGGATNSTTAAPHNNFSPTTDGSLPGGGDGGDSFGDKDWVGTGVAMSCVVVGFAVNAAGVQMASVVSMVLVVVITLPFFVYFFGMSPEIFAGGCNYSNFTDVPIFQMLPAGTAQWGPFLSTLIWSYTGYDTVGCIAGEVKNAHRTFVLGSLLTVACVVLTYALPIVSMVMVHPDLASWTDGVLMTFLGDVGLWLAIWGCVAAVVQNVGTYYAELAANSHAVWAMAGGNTGQSQAYVRHLPAFLSCSCRNVPLAAVTAHSLFVTAVLVLPVGFATIVQADMLCNSVRLVIEFASFLLLKFRHPELRRPYAVPGGKCGAILISLPKVAVVVLVCYSSNTLCWAVVGAANAAGALGFVLLKYTRCCGAQYAGRPWFQLPPKGRAVAVSVLQFSYDGEGDSDNDGGDSEASVNVRGGDAGLEKAVSGDAPRGVGGSDADAKDPGRPSPTATAAT